MIVGLSVPRVRAEAKPSRSALATKTFFSFGKGKMMKKKTENLINFFFWFRVGKFLRQSEKHKQKNKRIRSK
jgi:hypothetical protein